MSCIYLYYSQIHEEKHTITPEQLRQGMIYYVLHSKTYHLHNFTPILGIRLANVF